MGSESRRSSESCTLQPDRISFSRSTSESARQQKEHHEALRRGSQTSIKQSRQFPVRAGSPISKDTRYKRCSSPKSPTVKPSSSAPAQSTSDKAFSNWIACFQPTEGKKAMRCFKEASKHPPISRSSLSELEVSCIIANPKLRHDINFDRELHFRPNLDGDRGRRKLQQADDYWLALEPELEKYSYMLSDANGTQFRWTEEWQREFRSTQKRIPRLFTHIKEILYSLTPDQEVPGAGDALDVPLIMQQIERGVYNLSSLAHWLAALLKAHCAPMRDQWVEKMVDLLERGWAKFNARMIVEGLKELFGIMEAMKLDIANHQIRYFRYMLLDSTVRFERRYYTSRIRDGQINVATAQNWIHDTLAAGDCTSSSSLSSPAVTDRPTLTTFTTRFITSLLASNPTLPETFALDHDRLLLLRCDAHALIYTDICIAALAFLLRSCPRTPAHAARASAYLRSVLPVIVGRGASDARWAAKAGNIAVEVVRAAFGEFNNNSSSTSSSPQQPPQQQPKVDGAKMCEHLEAYFSRHLRPDSDMFLTRVATLRDRLTSRVDTDARSFDKVGAREAGEVLLIPHKAGRSSSDKDAMEIEGENVTVENNEHDAYEDVAARLTHIAVLHWRIWAPLVYLRQPGEALGNGDLEWEGWAEWAEADVDGRSESIGAGAETDGAMAMGMGS